MRIAATPTPDDLEATGECYAESGRIILGPSQYTDWTLVHGRPTLRVPPHIEYGHAWVESPDGSEVHDPTIGATLPTELYYALGNINPEDCLKYSRDEMRRKVVEFNHWGPWDGVDAAPPIEIDYDEDDDY